MKTRDWKDAAELVGIAAIVASLMFVGLQMKQAQDIANAERRQKRTTNFIEMRNAINEHADIWVSGNSDQELGEVEAVVFTNLIESVGEFYYFASNAAQDIGNERGAEITMHHFAMFLYENPGARQVWSSRDEVTDKLMDVLKPDRTSSGWDDKIQFALAKLDQMQE
jgi:hypothetical protein